MERAIGGVDQTSDFLGREDVGQPKASFKSECCTAGDSRGRAWPNGGLVASGTTI